MSVFWGQIANSSSYHNYNFIIRFNI